MLHETASPRTRKDHPTRKRGAIGLDDCIAETQEAVSDVFSAVIKSLPDSGIAPIVKHCLTLKKLFDRALIARVTCEAVGGRWRSFVGAFAALEMADCAVLAIDDILDETARRVGSKTLHTRWGVKNAVLAAEVAKSLATEILADAASNMDCHRVVAAFERAYREVQVGQYLDITYEQRSFGTVSIEMYLKMVQLTTGAQIAGCCEVGALLGAAPKELVESARRYGLQTGTAFQIRDDFVDYYDHEVTIGKVPFSDFVRQKKRLPLLLAWKMGSRYDRKKLKKLLDCGSQLSKADRRWLTANVAREEVVTMAQQIVRNIAQDARQHLDRLPSNVQRDLLGEILKIGSDL